MTRSGRRTTRNGVSRFATRWATAVTKTSYLPMSTAEIRRFLDGLTTSLTDAMLAEPFVAEPGRAAGRALVGGHLVNPDTLEHTLQMLDTEFLQHLAPAGPLPPDAAQRLTVLRAGIASGYADALRQRTLDEQEMIRQAMLVAREEAEQRLQARLRYQATHDPLTQLPNRTLFLRELAQALSGDAERVGVCYMDLDGFKVVNDSLGHNIGDDLLVAVAERLHRRLSRSGHLVARMGGDEFVILVRDPADTNVVVAVADAALTALETPVEIAGHQLALSASIGVVERPVAETSAAELVKDADITLSWAKSDGGNRWALYDAERNARDVARYTLSATMPGAMKRDEFFLHYQPLVDLSDGSVMGLEALIRWRHPRHGLIPPTRFIGLAEETGLIVALGRWVLEEACREAASWAQSCGRSPLVSVNFAVRQLRERTVVADVKRVLAETGLPADRLQLEVTESAVMGSPGEPLDALYALADMGIRIAVDDFGTGYSNLAYLRQLPLHNLKIAGAFVAGLDPGPEPERVDERIVATLVDLAHTLGLTVTAEGVETLVQAERLQTVGCDAGQGWYFARPVPADEVLPLLQAEFI